MVITRVIYICIHQGSAISQLHFWVLTCTPVGFNLVCSCLWFTDGVNNIYVIVGHNLSHTPAPLLISYVHGYVVSVCTTIYLCFQELVCIYIYMQLLSSICRTHVCIPLPCRTFRICLCILPALLGNVISVYISIFDIPHVYWYFHAMHILLSWFCINMLGVVIMILFSP